MEMNVAFLSPAEIALLLLICAVPSLAAIFWSRRALLSGASLALTVLARAFLLLGVVVIGLVVLSLMYPHGHHDTRWIPSKPQLNYTIDVAIGLLIAIGTLAVWRYPRPSRD
jgi:hypothetical protein